MTQLNEADPIWGSMPADVRPWGDGGREVDSFRTGGRYRLVGSVIPMIAGLSTPERVNLTTHIVDANRLGDETPIISTDTLRRVRAGRRPTVTWQMDRLLAYLAHVGHRPGTPLPWLGTHTQTPATIRARLEATAWIGAEREDELSAFRLLLEGAGLMRSDGQNTSMTAAGFARMDELQRGAIATDQVFVAMWFGKEMEAIYDEAIAPALIETGYRPLRIDKHEHLNKIDDQIIAEIRRSRFVVADFTCGTVETEQGRVAVPRGGVYYETGFAQGLGIPVVWCVREDQIAAVHFDTRQFNHIAWTDAEDLRTRLIHRIRAHFQDAV